MNEQRRPLTPVTGLKPTDHVTLPGPPRRPTIAPAAAPAAAPATTRKTPAPAPARPTAASGVVRASSLSLPASLVTALKARARAEKITQADVLMDALEATHDELKHHFEGNTTATTLFVRGPRRGGADEPLLTLPLRTRSENIDAIDTLTTDVGAPSRSALCAEALRRYLKA